MTIADIPGYEIMDAPNRYRKLFKAFTEDRASGEYEASGSSAVMLALCRPSPELAAAQDAAIAMQKAEWPEKADRAAGLTPHIDLVSVVLAWTAEVTP